tara:strand:+ start:3554 stop:3994 length:441 start_codon:yes stop_codon:yes gene_type:complete
MIFIKEIDSYYSKDCYELDLKSLNLWSQHQWEDEFKNKNITCLAIYENKLIMGICVFFKLFDEAELRYLSILPEFKRRGFGKKLFYKFLEQCKNENITKVFLEVSTNNKEALSFYKYFGFETITVRKKYFKDGSDALLKQKKMLKK